MKNIIAALDLLSDKIQGRGLTSFAERLDAVANTMELVAAVDEEKELRVPLLELPPEVAKSNKKRVIIQGFIIEVPDCDVRIRKVEDSYTLTAKFRPLHQEAEMEISEEMFETLWPSTTRKQTKTRYEYKGWEIDVMEDGNIVAEFEFTKEKKVDLPTHWKIKT